MSQTLRISNIQWVNLNTLSGISVGTRLLLDNVGTVPLRVQIAPSQPLVTDTKGILLQVSTHESINKEIGAGTDTVWVKAYGLTEGILTVQTNIEIKDFTGLDSRVYTGLQGLTIQPFTEANVKNGTQFTISDEIIVPVSSPVVYRGFRTPTLVDGRDTLIKTRIINTNGGMRYRPYAGQTGVVVGSSLPIVNLNSLSSNISGCSYYEIDSVTTEGVSFDVVRSTEGIGSNRQQGIFSGLGIERVLAKDTEYLLKFENLDNKDIYVVFSLTFYTGALSPDIL